MPKIVVPINNSAKPGESTLDQIKVAAAVAHPNVACEVIRDPITAKPILVYLHLPEDVDENEFNKASKNIEDNEGCTGVEKFPQKPIPDPGFEGHTVGQDPIQWGGATVEDLSGGTMVISNDAGRTAHGQKSLKVTLNSPVGSKCSWEHQANIKKGMVKRVTFGCAVYIPATPTGIETIVSIGAAPSGDGAALVISDGSPS